MLNSIMQNIGSLKYECSPRFIELLRSVRSSLLISLKQARTLMVVGTSDNQLDVSFKEMDEPMGIAASIRGIAISSRRHVHTFVPVPVPEPNASRFDVCFVPRISFDTGDLQARDIAWGRDGLWLASTRFSCLSTLHEDYHFVPRWRPPFLSKLSGDYQCGLSGIGMEQGIPRFATCYSSSANPWGWKAEVEKGGRLSDIANSNTLCDALSVPHTPRVHGGRLWVLDSGNGSLGYVDLKRGKFEPITTFPGFPCGLTFAGPLALVGYSTLSPDSDFRETSVARQGKASSTGVAIVQWESGEILATLKLQGIDRELFSIDVLEGSNNPMFLGSKSYRDHKLSDTEYEHWLLAPQPTNLPTPTLRLPLFGPFAAPSRTASTDTGSLTASQWIDMGNRLQDQSKQEQAAVCYQQAIAVDPNCIAAWQNLTYLWYNLGEPDKGVQASEELLKRDNKPLNQLLGVSILPVVYDSPQEIDLWRTRQCDKLNDMIRSNAKVDATQSLVPTNFFSAYQAKCNRELALLRSQIIHGRPRLAKERKLRAHGGKLRVGFLSAYFRDHTIGRLNLPRLENLSREKIELSIISIGNYEDSLAVRYKKLADLFVDLPRSIPQAINTLDSLELDILVFAEVGMDAQAGTLAYSRFAPIQIATWGHPDTTGSPSIDYFLSSQHLEPVDGEKNYSEKLLKTPTIAIDYEDPVEHASHKTRHDLGLSPDAHLYGCPQTLFKIHPDMDEVFARILERDPQGQILLLEGTHRSWQHQLQRRFLRTIPESQTRVRFLPLVPRPDYLSLLSCCDVLLDPIHFGGGNSSLESLGMLTPIVTIEGAFLRNRITSAIYRQVGLEDWIAADVPQYVDLAVELATSSEQRQLARERLQAVKPKLFDSKTGAQELEAILVELATMSNSTVRDGMPKETR